MKIKQKFKFSILSIIAISIAMTTCFSVFMALTIGDKKIEFKINIESDTLLPVNVPKLVVGMIPIVWDATSSKWKVVSSTSPSWYDYQSKKWANVMMSDGTYDENSVEEGQLLEDSELGSMFVWIPRYEYTINSTNKTILVNFVIGNSTSATAGYTIHPAFRNGTSTSFLNGEWDTELEGLWVAKFEMSDDGTGDLLSLPNKASYTRLTILEMDAKAKLATYGITNSTLLNSHMMKNSEWGAVAYLAHSSFGLNGQNTMKINCYRTNTNSATFAYITGYGSAGIDTAATTNAPTAQNRYDGDYGKLATTTGNITGVYDMKGAGNEYVAAYLAGYGDFNSQSATSTKYYTAYALNENKIGDAVSETAGWQSDKADKLTTEYYYFMRGGANSNTNTAGIFASCTNITNGNPGDANPYRSFRTVLAVE